VELPAAPLGIKRQAEMLAVPLLQFLRVLRLEEKPAETGHAFHGKQETHIPRIFR